jgi:hypothetical protein
VQVVAAIALLPLVLVLDRWEILVIGGGAVLIYRAVTHVRRKNRIATARPMLGAAPALSYVRVDGLAEAAPGDAPLRDPINDVPCLWFAVETWRRHTGNRPGLESLVKRAESSRPFLVRDALGVCKIFPTGAQVDVPAADSEYAGSGMTHRIWRIHEGDRITVAGAAATAVSTFVGADRQIVAPPDDKDFLIVCRRPSPIPPR